MSVPNVVTPSLEEVKAILSLPVNAGCNLVPLVKDLAGDLETPVSAFLKGKQRNYP
jgi:hypothetical protein